MGRHFSAKPPRRNNLTTRHLAQCSRVDGRAVQTFAFAVSACSSPTASRYPAYRLPRAGVVRATLVADIDHAVLSMLPAVRCRLAVELE